VITFKKQVKSAIKRFVATPYFLGVLIFMFGAWIALSSNALGAATVFCGQGWFRTICAYGGLAGVASPTEERFWVAASSRVDGEGLRQYLRIYPDGEFAREAALRLQTCRRVERENWDGEEKTLPLMVMTALVPSVSQVAAKDIAIASGKTDAAVMCRNYEAGQYRLRKSDVRPEHWSCSARGRGVVCGFEGVAVCQVQTRFVEVHEDCT
jgi:hypothetical protein